MALVSQSALLQRGVCLVVVLAAWGHGLAARAQETPGLDLEDATGVVMASLFERLYPPESFHEPYVSSVVNPHAELFLPAWYAGFFELRGTPELVPSERYQYAGYGRLSDAGRRLALLYGYHYVIWARERAKLLAGEDPFVVSLVASTFAIVGSATLSALEGDLQERLYLNTRLTIDGFRFGLSVASDQRTGEWQGLIQVDLSQLAEYLKGSYTRRPSAVAMRSFWEPGRAFFLNATPWAADGESVLSPGFPGTR